jgi:hypothetical protein
MVILPKNDTINPASFIPTIDETMREKSVVILGLENRLFVAAAKLLPSSTFTGIARFISLRGHKK